MILDRKNLYNPLGEDGKKFIVNGNCTGLMNLNNVQYNWAVELNKKMVSNFWIPEKYSMVDDAKSYVLLTPDERECYDKILSFLIFLDSLQTQNLPRICDYITTPEVSSCLVTHTYQENVHVLSYQYILLSLNLSYEQREKIYYYWREFEPLAKRNKLITDNFLAFDNDKSSENFFKVLISNYLLEGLYFYVGFMFFYNLSLQNKMVNTSNIIRIIQKDEMTHMVLFENLIREFLKQNYIENHEEIVYDLFSKAVTEEVIWDLCLFGGNKILGFDEVSITNYVHYLADLRLMKLGYKKIFGVEKNPFSHLEKMANVKGNFFETKVTEYQQSSKFEDWGDW